MSAEWRFEPKRRSQKSRDPMQASFFTNASIDDDTHALVREAIQNSLDAKFDRGSQNPVCVRFALGTHKGESPVMTRYISLDAWDHFNAVDNGLATPPTAVSDCRYLVYEDFNTDGLIGDERAFEAQPKNSFYYFMRAEGQSGKEDGERGRHGIGKFVFPYTSGIRMFIAATVRSSDARCLIAGQSVLKSHQVGEQRFTPDGWWGKFEKDGEDDYFQLPVEDEALFQQIKSDFGLQRNMKQSGLSLIMPYVHQDVAVEKISEHVIKEYFWPILSSQLVVEISDEEQVRIIDSNSIHKNLKQLLPQEQIDKVSPFLNLAVKAIAGTSAALIELNLPATPSMPKWDKDYLTKANASSIHEALNNADAFIQVRCPIYVQKAASKEAVASFFNIFLSRDISDVARKPQFVREGITIPEDRVSVVRGYTSIVVIEPGNLATLLGDSENPAHTEWEKNAAKFKGKYRWGPTTIDFVRGSVTKLLNLLSQSDDEEDVTILSDIFYLNLPENDEEVPDSRKRKDKQNPGNEINPEPDPIPQPSHRNYRLTKCESGFVLQGTNAPTTGHLRFKVSAAYDFAGASKARAIKKYHKNDFDLGKAKNVNPPIMEKLDNVEVGGNTITFSAEKGDFRLEVTGFDKRRDIIVNVDAEDVVDEKV